MSKKSLQLRVGRGSLAGRKVVLHDPRVRPTRTMVREAQVDIINSRGWLDGADVLVPFAGSGITGFDLLSAGASSVHFVETDRKQSQNLQNIVKEFELEARAKVSCANIRRFRSAHKCTGMLADPPWQNGWIDDLDWINVLHQYHCFEWIILESELLEEAIVTKECKRICGSFNVEFRKYGNSLLTILENEVQ